MTNASTIMKVIRRTVNSSAGSKTISRTKLATRPDSEMREPCLSGVTELAAFGLTLTIEHADAAGELFELKHNVLEVDVVGWLGTSPLPMVVVDVWMALVAVLDVVFMLSVEVVVGGYTVVVCVLQDVVCEVRISKHMHDSEDLD